jgi:photosystem II oxygen-evolving enhancer protein 1
VPQESITMMNSLIIAFLGVTAVPGVVAFIAVPAVKQPAIRGAVPGAAQHADDGEKTGTASWKEWQRPATAAAMAAATLVAATQPTFAITSEERAQLSYLQVKGTGLANRCSTVKGTESIGVKAGQKMVDMCLEPKAFFVEETVNDKKGDTKTDFVATKLMTRQTYTLDGISGSFGNDGNKLTFKEEDGIDYAATTVQLPGGERVPFLFTVKDLVAKGANDGNSLKPGFEFGGNFKVPSYRTGLFLDPKGRGMSTGYDMAQALPAYQSGVEEGGATEENNKVFDVLGGSIEFEVQNVNLAESEISGVFVSAQPSDTDMGAKEPRKLLMKGTFYGRIE